MLYNGTQAGMWRVAGVSSPTITVQYVLVVLVQYQARRGATLRVAGTSTVDWTWVG